MNATAVNARLFKGEKFSTEIIAPCNA